MNMRKLIFTLLLFIGGAFLVNAQPVVVFSEDFEPAADSVTSSGTPGWFIQNRLQVSGVNADSASVQAIGDDSYLETDPFSTAGNFFVTLTFQSICKLEFFDAGTIEISTDGGFTWTKLQDNTGSNPGDNCVYMGTGNFPSQNSKFGEASYGIWEPGVASTPQNSWWQLETFDISQIASDFADVRLRFRAFDENNSGGQGRAGWFIDDINVVASFCELIPPFVTLQPPSPANNANVYNLGPFTINATATDVSGVSGVILNYWVNGVAQPFIAMTFVADSNYTASIPAVNDSDEVCYIITAFDASACNNTTVYPPNDTICFEAFAGISFPYCDNFDVTLDLWHDSLLIGGNPGTHWELGTPAFGATNSAHTPPNSWDINLTTAYTNGANVALMSPALSFPNQIGAGATFSFWQNRNTENFWDGVRIEWTDDPITGTWQLLAANPDTVNWYNFQTLNCSGQPGWAGNSGGWVQSSIILDSQFNGLSNVYFRFVFCSDGSVIVDGFSIDGLCIALPEPDDVGVTSIIQPGTTGPAGVTIPVVANVKNFGLNTQSSFPITYMTSDGQTAQIMYSGPPLAPGDVQQVTFNPGILVPNGSYSICVYTQLAGDANNFNDTLCKGSLGIPVLQLTACDDFESGNNGYQDSTTNAAAAQWQLGTPNFGVTTGAHSGTNAWDINLNNGYGFGANAYLTTPIYDLANPSPAINPYLSFWRNMRVAQNDGLRIYYNANGSGFWQLLGTVGDANGFNWYETASLGFGDPGFSGTTSGWEESRYYLQDLMTSQGITFIQFRFEFVSGFNSPPNDGVSIDDLCVKQPDPNDVGVTLIQSPITYAPAGTLSDAIVTIRNFGTVPQNNFDVEYTIDGTVTGTATYSAGPLAPGNVATVVLPQFTVPPGQFDFCAYTKLAGDADNSNDTMCVTSVGIPVIAVNYTNPYIDNFDGPNAGWSTIVNGAPGSMWELGPPAFGTTNTAHSAPNAWDVNLNSAYTNAADCILMSPIFDLTGSVDPQITFWINHATEGFWDGVRMDYTLDGVNWIQMGPNAPNPPCWVNWYNQPNVNALGTAGWAGNSGGWVLVQATCNGVFDNEDYVQFRYVFKSDGIITVDGFSIDDWNLTIPVPLTASPVTVNTNAINNCFIFPGQQVQFSVPISNPGTTALNTVEATLVIPGQPNNTQTVTFNPPLQTGQVSTYTYTQTWTAAPGVYNVCVYTSNPNGSADLNPTDDTTCVSICVFDSVSVTSGNPYCTDFESGPQWVSVNSLTLNPSGNDWQIGAPSQTIINNAFSGTNAWTIDLDENYDNRDTSGLFTPVFSVDNTKCYKLSFMHKFDTEPFADGGTVEYSTDNATSWNQLGFASGQPQPWFNTAFITALGGVPGTAGWSGTETSWITAEKEVNFAQSGTVMFRFRFASDNTVNNYEGWAIDDFCFAEIPLPCTVGINDPVEEGLSLGQNYPNPYNGSTTIGYTIPSAGDVKVSITNLLGQEIAVPVNGSRAAGYHTFEVNAHTLNPGIYYYTLEFAGEQITRKMIVTD
jgi:hypothetical protein